MNPDAAIVALYISRHTSQQYAALLAAQRVPGG
jgi:hypothetical protein